MNSFKEMATELEKCALEMIALGVLGKQCGILIHLAEQLSKFEAVIFVGVDENGANVTAAATASFPLRVATHDYVKGESDVISEFVLVGAPNKLEEWIADQLKGSGDDEDLD